MRKSLPLARALSLVGSVGANDALSPGVRSGADRFNGAVDNVQFKLS